MTPIRGQVIRPWKLKILPFSKSLLPCLLWELAHDYWFFRFNGTQFLYLAFFVSLSGELHLYGGVDCSPLQGDIFLVLVCVKSNVWWCEHREGKEEGGKEAESEEGKEIKHRLLAHWAGPQCSANNWHFAYCIVAVLLLPLVGVIISHEAGRTS